MHVLPLSLCSWVVFLFELSHCIWVISFFGKKYFTLSSSLYIFPFYFILFLLNSFKTIFVKSRGEKKCLYYRLTEGVHIILCVCNYMIHKFVNLWIWNYINVICFICTYRAISFGYKNFELGPARHRRGPRLGRV